MKGGDKDDRVQWKKDGLGKMIILRKLNTITVNIVHYK